MHYNNMAFSKNKKYTYFLIIQNILKRPNFQKIQNRQKISNVKSLKIVQNVKPEK